MPDFDLKSLSDQFAAVIATAAPRLVAVHGADGGALSGIIWSTGLVVTAHEALEGEDDVKVTLPDGSTVPAHIAGRDPTTDVALLKLETPTLADWARAPTPAVGSIALAAGRGEHSPLARFGQVAEVGPAWRSMRGGEIDARITLDLRLNGRIEGGAALTPDGALIGMAVNGPRRRALVIPATTIDRAVKTLAEKGYVPRGYLGVSLHRLGEGNGAIIVGLEANSPAANGGLLIGDIITTWNGEPVRGVGDVSKRLSGSAVGAPAKLGVQRGGNPIVVEIAIGERPRG